MGKKRTLNLEKAAHFAIVINSLQVLSVLLLCAYLFGRVGGLSALEYTGLGAIAFVIIWGGIVDIRDAFSALRAAEESDMLEDAFAQLSALNLTLRKQRHDFMNHLQVVFGLIELGQVEDARAYIERVYGDVQKVGRGMKTALPALNALLAAKLGECEKRQIDARFSVLSDWHDIPVPAWELCRVLGNLIDNSIDALSQAEGATLTVELGESLSEYSFRVQDNGSGVPDGFLEHIFQAGFTTKRTGHGMGLSIVRDILRSWGGDVIVDSQQGTTCFAGRIPKGDTQRRLPR